MFLVPLIVVLGGGYFLPRYVLCRGSNDTKLNFVFALVCVSGASLLQYYPEPGLCHVFWSVAPGLGVFTYFIWKLLGLRHGAAALVIALMFLPPTIQKAHLGCTNLLRPLSELNEPSVLSGMKVPAPLAEYIGVLDSATRSILDKYPNTPIVVKGDDALYATFAKNHWNASPYCIEWAGLMSGQKLNLKLEEIHKRRPIVLFQKIPYSDKDAVSLDTVMPFNKSENYAVIAEIPFQPLRWWWGGQQEKDMVTVDSPLRSMVVVAPQELLPEKNSQ